MNFSLFLLALYQLWDRREQHKQHTPPTSVCALSWHADSGKRNTSTVAWFQASNAVYMRSAVFWDFTQRRLVVFCRRFVTTVGVREIPTAVLVKIQVIWDVAPCWLVNLPSSSGSTVQDEGTAFHRNVRNPSVDRAWSASTPVWERHVSWHRRPCGAELLCMTYLFCEDHCRIHKNWTHFTFRAPGTMIY